MAKQQISTIEISTRVVLRDSQGRVMTRVTAKEYTTPGVFGGTGDSNAHSAASKIHTVTKELGERVAVSALDGLKDI